MSSKLYKPLHYLRAHAKSNDAADISTQVWQCAFEPNLKIPGEHTNVVATCGGNSVCFIDADTGRVLRKFNSEDKKEIFFALAWSSLPQQETTNILAAAGTKRRIYLFTPSESRCVCSQLEKGGSKVSVNSLIFHPLQPDILFIGLSSGDIIISRVQPQIRAEPVLEICSLQAHSDIHQLAFSPACSTLLAACSEGLQAWTFGSDLTTCIFEGVKIELPVPTGAKDHGTNVFMVDSVVTLGSGSLIASKRCLEGHILVWDLASVLRSVQNKGKPKPNENQKICVTKGRYLKWSDTDNFYMGLGWNDSEKLLACGDDKGCVWLYNLRADLGDLGDLKVPPLQPWCKLPWPKQLQDPQLSKTHKLRISTYDIVLAQVVLAGPYLVTVTNNNLVCVWCSPGL